MTLMGWVARRRDFGPLTFVDLRDRDGITQVVFNEETAPAAHAKAKDVRGEYVIAVTGEVVLRAEGQRNPKIATGEINRAAKPCSSRLTFSMKPPPPEVASLEVVSGTIKRPPALRLSSQTACGCVAPALMKIASQAPASNSAPLACTTSTRLR